MSKFLLSGSTKQGLTSLEPQYIFGSNGAQDGFGVNLSNSVDTALNYAMKGSTSSVYVIEVEDLDDYLTIDGEHFLTEEQAYELECSIDELGAADRARLYTDILGRVEVEYPDAVSMEEAFDEMYEFSQMANLDRLRPKFVEKDSLKLSCPRRDGNVEELMRATTGQIHYALTLYDLHFATDTLKGLAHGLVLPKESGATYYLSFRFQEDVAKEVVLNGISHDAAKKLVNEEVGKLERGEQDFKMTVDRYARAFIDQKGVLYDDQYDVQYPNHVVTEIDVELFPRPHIDVSGASGESDTLTRALRNLLNSNPDFADYPLRFDNYKVSLSEYIQSASNVDRGSVLYHGTSSAIIESIGLDGLLPRNVSDMPAHFIGSAGESLVDRVYLASKEGIGAATFAANSAVSKYGGSRVVLEIDCTALDADSFVPDEDSGKCTAKESLEQSGTVAYQGVIPSKAVMGICTDDFIPEDARRDFEVSLATELFNLAKARSGDMEVETSVALENSLIRSRAF
ncbi:hypothetical protein VCHA53O466_50017 [Vibrio chagasii]|nr:hypothetical protein VCHA53O466_50017 [Vibrio chagasii]